MLPNEFFQTHIGSKIGISPGGTVKSVRILQRAKEGVKTLSIGQMDCFYIANGNGPSSLLGRLELSSSPGLQVIGTETTSARKYMAEWLLNEAAVPFMIGVIGKAHPEPSYCITNCLALTQFCESSGNFQINLEQARAAYQRIAHFDWKKVVAPAIYAYHDYIQAPRDDNQKERARLQQLIAKEPELARILPTLGVRPGSGEYTLLSWKNIEQKQ